MSSDMSNILLVGAIVGGIYLYSTGFFSNIIPPPIGPQTPPEIYDEDVVQQFKKEAEGEKKKKKKKDKEEEGPPPGYMPPQPQYQGPPPYPTNAPMPGLISSILPMDVPNGPPYTSQTVNTYSQYSPYNQFNAYQEYRTPPRGTASTMADDNILFNDIRTDSSACYRCKTYCQSSPNSFPCLQCRMPCKNITHTFIPPARGWTIAPVGTIPNYPTSYLGMVWDNLLGKGATFTEMDDYSQKRRFDCHNKLKRRVKGKDNSFVQQQDYHYDRNDISIANA